MKRPSWYEQLGLSTTGTMKLPRVLPMKRRFARTSNVKRFLVGMASLEKRGAGEASWMLVTGLPGLGKTKLVEWYCSQQFTGYLPSIYLRAKTTWTPRVLLTELVSTLGMVPGRRKDEMYAQALGMLARDPHALVIDEVEHCLRNGENLETLRDISDVTYSPIVLVGMDAVKTKIQRHEQISSRINQVVEFQPSTADDVRTMAHELTDLDFTDELIQKILVESEGRYRLIMDALAAVDRVADANGWHTVGAEQFVEPLTHDWRLRTRKLTKPNDPGDGNGNGNGRKSKARKREEVET